MNLYELQIGKTINRKNNIRRISVRVTEREKDFIDKCEKILFNALRITVGFLMMIITILLMWLMVSFLILFAQ